MHLQELKAKSPADLLAYAEELEIENDNYTKQIKQLQNEYDFSIKEYLKVKSL